MYFKTTFFISFYLYLQNFAFYFNNIPYIAYYIKIYLKIYYYIIYVCILLFILRFNSVISTFYKR